MQSPVFSLTLLWPFTSWRDIAVDVEGRQPYSLLHPPSVRCPLGVIGSLACDGSGEGDATATATPSKTSTVRQVKIKLVEFSSRFGKIKFCKTGRSIIQCCSAQMGVSKSVIRHTVAHAPRE